VIDYRIYDPDEDGHTLARSCSRQYGSVKGYAVLKTINTGGFIMIPVPLCLTCLERNFETGFLTTLGLFL
jgi:hypothetical protein